MYRLLFWAYLGAFFSPIYCLEDISVAVPCYWKHFQYLEDLLDRLCQQTHLPKEVIISLSQIENLAPETIDSLENRSWPFSVKILRRPGIHMEGSNRTLAASSTHSPLIACIDADDLPHPQWLEAICKVFETQPKTLGVFFGHAYCPGSSNMCTKTIPWYDTVTYAALRWDLSRFELTEIRHVDEFRRWDTGIVNGSLSIHRDALNNGLVWFDRKNGADIECNQSLLHQAHSLNSHVFFIKLPLLHYLNARSSGRDVGR